MVQAVQDLNIGKKVMVGMLKGDQEMTSVMIEVTQEEEAEEAAWIGIVHLIVEAESDHLVGMSIKELIRWRMRQ